MNKKIIVFGSSTIEVYEMTSKEFYENCAVNLVLGLFFGLSIGLWIGFY